MRVRHECGELQIGLRPVGTPWTGKFPILYITQRNYFVQNSPMFPVLMRYAGVARETRLFAKLRRKAIAGWLASGVLRLKTFAA
jgi:hypothetical protein